MDNFNLRKYLAEGRLYEEEYLDLVPFLNTNVKYIKQHMRDELLNDDLDDADDIEGNEELSKKIDAVKSFEDVSKDSGGQVVGAVAKDGIDTSAYQITYMFKDDYDALEDKTKFENDEGYLPKDVKIAGKELKFFTFGI